jgi:probable phosphoglycerate mutase
MSVEIFVARHGQNEDNANGILNGHRDLPLTALGRQQANDLAVAISDLGLTFDAIYCSPLLRAHETAEIISNVAHQPVPQVKNDLIERDFGGMSGEPVTIIKTLPADQVIETDTITYFLNPMGGETFEHVLSRANNILKDINDVHVDGKVLIVCHGDMGKMLYAAATGKDWRQALTDFHFGNAELIDLSGNGDVHTITFEQFNH